MAAPRARWERRELEMRAKKGLWTELELWRGAWTSISCFVRFCLIVFSTKISVQNSGYFSFWNFSSRLLLCLRSVCTVFQKKYSNIPTGFVSSYRKLLISLSLWLFVSPSPCTHNYSRSPFGSSLDFIPAPHWHRTFPQWKYVLCYQHSGHQSFPSHWVKNTAAIP